MGTLISLKENVFAQGNKISKQLESLGPLFLKTLRVIPSLKIDYLELPVKEAS